MRNSIKTMSITAAGREKEDQKGKQTPLGSEEAEKRRPPGVVKEAARLRKPGQKELMESAGTAASPPAAPPRASGRARRAGEGRGGAARMQTWRARGGTPRDLGELAGR